MTPKYENENLTVASPTPQCRIRIWQLQGVWLDPGVCGVN